MVKIPVEVRAFLQKVKRKFVPDKIYIFGSRAAGKAARISDWDFIVVSKCFKGVDGYRRSVAIYELAAGDFALDVICFTPQEFENRKKEVSIISEAIEKNTLVEVSV
ncbi:MAG: nucleotidyltransferase domain-containing protein [Candidatus Aenigmarchaeota archaeon]|nr:nucleotidyltransferase domain-containing protein [Candidatus Aenigmarchaeota archaeon]